MTSILHLISFQMMISVTYQHPDRKISQSTENIKVKLVIYTSISNLSCSAAPNIKKKNTHYSKHEDWTNLEGAPLRFVGMYPNY